MYNRKEHRRTPWAPFGPKNSSNRTMIEIIKFDNSRARTYRKRVEVLAFQADAPITYHKSWGNQEVRTSGWVIVPLTEDGDSTQDIYGCDSDVFDATYEASPSERPNCYRKKETIRAYQPGDSFKITTKLSDGHVEVKETSTADQDAWIVQAPGKELYIIDNNEFARTYIEVA